MRRKIFLALVFGSMLLLSACQIGFDDKVKEVGENEKVSQDEKVTEEDKVVEDADVKFQAQKEGGDVKFYETAKEIKLTDFLPWETLKKVAASRYGDPNTNPDVAAQEWLKSAIDKAHEVGVITKAPYENWKLVVLDASCDGPCFSTPKYRFAWDANTNKIVLLTKYSTAQENSFVEYLSLYEKKDSQTSLVSMNLPEKIKVPNSDKYLSLISVDASFNEEDFVDENLAFVDAQAGKVYKSQISGCLMVKTLDGGFGQYVYETGFSDENGPLITFDNGGTASEGVGGATDYTLAPTGGCIVDRTCYKIVNIDKKNLKSVGKADNGIELFALSKAVYIPYLEGQGGRSDDGTGNSEISAAFDNYKSRAEYPDPVNPLPELTFEQFVGQNPVLFWQDPLGRWSMLNSVDSEPLAECGKPVIYLYPEQTTDVNVQVGIEKLTVTIPDYGVNGWTVRAEPNGKIYNYADKQSYPYLFWEGYADKGMPVNRGFVVKREEVVSFLNKSLDEMGLNAQEKADFMEFWPSRMLNNPEPYFMISFMGTKAFNEVAPLAITPTPDTLIRVFMYYQPLSTPVSVEPQKLSAIERKGFTVVEWGGSSSRPWKK